MDTQSTTTTTDPSPQPDRRSFLKLALGTALLAPAAAACGGDKRGALGGGGGGSGGKVTELVVPINKSPWLPAFQQLAAQYEKERGVTITLREFPYEGLKTAMTNAIQGGGHPFDIYLLDEPWTGQFYANGWVTPLGEIDSSYEWDPQVIDYDLLPRWDAKTKQVTRDGAVMGLPVNGNVNVFAYRKDLYDDLGLSVPKTFDDVVRNAEKGKQSGKVDFGYVVRAQSTTTGQSITYDFMPVLYAFGGDWYDADWAPAIDGDGAKAAAQMFRRLASFGPPQPQTVGQSEVIAAMQGGKALQCHTVAAAAGQLLDPEKSNVADKVGFARMPAGSTGKSTPTSGVWTMAVPEGLAKDRGVAAQRFITWLLSAKSQLAFTKAGGIPTRRDTYAEQGLQKSAKPYLDVIAAGLPGVRRSVRFPFAAEMLPPAERILAAITSGKMPVEKGLGDLAKELAAAARKAGYGQ